MQRLRLFLLVISASFMAVVAQADDQRPGSIAGAWKTAQGEPMANGLVLVFNASSGPPPSSENYWRVPDYLGSVDGDGRFRVQVKPGNYFLGVLKRQKGNEVGPFQPGDEYSFSKDGQGKPRIHQVRSGEETGVGVLVGAARFNGAPQKGATAIEGTVVDQAGNPLQGVSVFAFVTSQMQGRPLFVSPKTGKDGRFRLGLGQGGTYYLKIREIYGGGPLQAGQLTGFYGEGSPAPLKIETGIIAGGITIKGGRFAGRGTSDPQ